MSRIIELYNTYHSDKKNSEFVNYLMNPENLQSINEPDVNIQTVLHNATYDEDILIVKMLLERRADVSIKDKYKRTPLSYCIDSSADINLSILRLLITAGANINDADERGFTSLHYAVLAGNLVKVKKLLSLGANLNQHNQNMETPLTLALTRNIPKKQEMLELLFNSSVIISQDFSDVNIPRGLTDGAIMIGSTVWSDTLLQDVPIDRTMKGFEHAITNTQEFEAATKSGVKFDYKAIEVATRHSKSNELWALRQLALAKDKTKDEKGLELKRSLAQGLAILLSKAGNAERIKLEAKILAMPDDIRNLVEEEMNKLALEKSNQNEK